jgi:hypothetical protein
MLPNLPRKNKLKEFDLYEKFRTEFFKRKMPSGDYELKDTRGKKQLNWKEITDEQINSALRTQSEKGNLIRIINGTPGAPDYRFTKNGQAFFVIRFPESIEVITVENLLFEKSKGNKSLSAERAKAISTMTL